MFEIDLDEKSKEKIKEIFGTLNKKQENFISKLYELAVKDHKTKVYNSKFFNDVLSIELEKARRKKGKLCIFVIDIDYFKKINDSYGHLIGDKILYKFARILEKNFRKTDVISRFGGEEFFILLPNTSKRNANKIIKRVQNSIKNDSFLKKYKITFSGGLTEYRDKDTKTSFKKRADSALYKAKKSGRDRVVVL
ncbi:MAG: hypothetical protein KatS3mg001_538 [Candidatus Pacearchaeota archaeon]|nr:MAG: hypothetical protein KatS3mg001_538 [Candidatus Pacearchaeota archaeon]